MSDHQRLSLSSKGAAALERSVADAVAVGTLRQPLQLEGTPLASAVERERSQCYLLLVPRHQMYHILVLQQEYTMVAAADAA
mmetsp:Transcript_1944/g.4182  ORF Transcript_1944/g.4182 Transcript_1944/m.4182 type:complete len:82 (-) Transcript_1944:2779-3024(-)